MPTLSGAKVRRKRQSSSKPLHYRFSIALAVVITTGIAVAWTPRFWGISIVHTGILLVAAAWLMLARDWKPPARLVLVFAGVIALWGWAQYLFLGSVAAASTRKLALEWTVAIIAFLLATQVLAQSQARRIFLEVVLWSSAIFCILAILQMYSAPTEVFWLFPAEPLTIGTFLYKNQFASMIELAMPIALYSIFFNTEKRSAGLFAFAALFAGVIASGSRAGAGLVMLECLVALFLAYRENKVRLAFILIIVPIAAALLGAIALIAGNDVVWAHFQEVHPDTVRQELLKSTLQMIKNEPWSGYGLGAWPVIYPQYATFDIGRFANAAHNDWVEWTSEGGIVFVAGIFGLFACALKRAFTSVWGLGVIAIMLHSAVDYPTREPVLCVLWLCLAGALLAKRNTAPESKSAE